jgi:O2-independent ubiquinone biosynthesis accessory factor UbiT
MAHFTSSSTASDTPRWPPGWSLPSPLSAIQPVLGRIINRIAVDNPEMFGRLGPHYNALFVIDPVNLPFVLVLRPDPDDLLLVARSRKDIPRHDAKISGSFLDLLMLVDGDVDGDALFFARDLTIAGNTEAVVCLRNALDDIEGSIAAKVADMFGPPGRATLEALRHVRQHNNSSQGQHK